MSKTGQPTEATMTPNTLNTRNERKPSLRRRGLTMVAGVALTAFVAAGCGDERDNAASASGKQHESGAKIDNPIEGGSESWRAVLADETVDMPAFNELELDSPEAQHSFYEQQGTAMAARTVGFMAEHQSAIEASEDESKYRFSITHHEDSELVSSATVKWNQFTGALEFTTQYNPNGQDRYTILQWVSLSPNQDAANESVDFESRPTMAELQDMITSQPEAFNVSFMRTMTSSKSDSFYADDITLENGELTAAKGGDWMKEPQSVNLDGQQLYDSVKKSHQAQSEALSSFKFE